MVEKSFERHQLDWQLTSRLRWPAEAIGDAVRGIRAMGFSAAAVRPPQPARRPVSRCASNRPPGTASGSGNVIFRDESGLVGENTEGKGYSRQSRACRGGYRRNASCCLAAAIWPEQRPVSWPAPGRVDRRRQSRCHARPSPLRHARRKARTFRPGLPWEETINCPKDSTF